MGHTKEPWRVGRCSVSMGTIVSDSPVPEVNGSGAIEYYGGHLIAESITRDNARRIVACVNACEGIDTENLEMIGRMFADKKLASTPLHIIDKVESENKRLRDLLERHLGDNPKNERDYCNCQLCQDTCAALGDYGAESCPHCGVTPYIREAQSIIPGNIASGYRAVCARCKQ
jgi:hypothetical protein